MLVNLSHYIEYNKDILGGRPIFKGTRIPVESITNYLDSGDDPKLILEDYPQLTLEIIEYAREYIKKYPENFPPMRPRSSNPLYWDNLLEVKRIDLNSNEETIIYSRDKSVGDLENVKKDSVQEHLIELIKWREKILRLKKLSLEIEQFEKYKQRVKYVIENLLKEDPLAFDRYINRLNEQEKQFLMHMDELEAAALCFGLKSKYFTDLNPILDQMYSSLQRFWLNNCLKDI